MTKDKMDRIESYSKVSGIALGLIAAIIALGQFRQSLIQNREELRWKQAGLVREMINKMVNDEGWDAMLMLDWEEQGREFQVKDGVKEIIKGEDVYKALATDTRTYSEKEVFIRDRFDRLFFLVGQLQSAVISNLVKIEDVRFPLMWYAAHGMSQRKELFENYMKAYSPPEALDFFRSLGEWKGAASDKRPNQAMELTASRRFGQISMSATRRFAPTRALARGG